MSQVAFVIDDLGPRKAEAIKILRSIDDLGFSEINASIASGKPLIQRRLLDRASPKFSIELLGVLKGLERIGTSFKAFELLDNQEFSSADREGYYEITSNRLSKMIESRELSLKQQRLFGELGL